MNFDANNINRHILAEGNIQTSPAEVQQLNMQPPAPFKASYIKSSADSGYKVFLSGYANNIFQKELLLK